MGILDVHDLIADVVGRLHEVNQREARVAQRALGRWLLRYAQLGGDALVVGLLGIEESELLVLACQLAGERIFHYARQCAVGHAEAAAAASLEMVCQQAEGIGVTLEVCEVAPLSWREARVGGLVFVSTEPSPFALAEECGNGPFAGVPEGRVPEVVGQTRCADDVGHLGEM